MANHTRHKHKVHSFQAKCCLQFSAHFFFALLLKLILPNILLFGFNLLLSHATLVFTQKFCVQSANCLHFINTT